MAWLDWNLAAACLLGYLLGSIPFGLLITRFAGKGDIREIGSGNIGATNVLRTGSKPLTAATLVADILKGTFAVLIAAIWLDHPLAAVAAGFCAFLGHLFPVWLGFKGGKGVATYFGVVIALSWITAIVFAVVWLAMARLTRYSSASALVATLVTPLAYVAVGGNINTSLVLLAMTVIAYWRHKDNIRRLTAGTEKRIGAKS